MLSVVNGAEIIAELGSDRVSISLIATEWNATATNGCVGDVTPRIAVALVRYIQSTHIGLIGWAIDSE
jgi:endoglucanase